LRRPRLEPLLVLVATVAAAALLTVPASGGRGLPSFEKGVFHSATIGYYLETAALMNQTGWWTPNWCCGFQDLLRFYPPLGNLLLLALLHATGSPTATAGAAMAAALAALAAGTALAARELAGRRAVPLVLLSLIAVTAWVSTIAVYWEYTRLLGDGLALAGLALLARSLRAGDERVAARAGALAGLTVLTSLVSTVWLTAASLAVIAYAAREVARETPYALPGLARLAAVYVLSAAAVSLWWLIPAVAPWGLGHYLRVKTPLGVKLSVLAEGLSLAPPLWAPTVQAPLLAATLAVLVAARRLGARGGGGPALWATVLVAVLVLAYGQGLRLVPVVALLLLIAGLHAAEALGGRRGSALLLILAAIVVLYAVHYYGVYRGLLERDYSFLRSDEYRAAVWLESLAWQGSPVRVYAMYGPRLHGNQWLNVFAPHVGQALSGFMEGCLDARAYRLDYLIKESLDVEAVYRLLRETCTNYLLVDRAWLQETRPNVVEMMEERGLLEPVNELNRLLSYSVLLRVKGLNCVPEPSIEPVFWTPARLLGLAATAAAALLLRRMTRG